MLEFSALFWRAEILIFANKYYFFPLQEKNYVFAFIISLSFKIIFSYLNLWFIFVFIFKCIYINANALSSFSFINKNVFINIYIFDRIWNQWLLAGGTLPDNGYLAMSEGILVCYDLQWRRTLLASSWQRASMLLNERTSHTQLFSTTKNQPAQCQLCWGWETLL